MVPRYHRPVPQREHFDALSSDFDLVADKPGRLLTQDTRQRHSAGLPNGARRIRRRVMMQKARNGTCDYAHQRRFAELDPASHSAHVQRRRRGKRLLGSRYGHRGPASAASARPPLKPNQPTHSIAAPIITKQGL